MPFHQNPTADRVKRSWADDAHHTREAAQLRSHQAPWEVRSGSSSRASQESSPGHRTRGKARSHSSTNQVTRGDERLN